MKKADIVLFYEHFAREFDILAAIKAIIEDTSDYNVQIASIKYDRPRILRKFSSADVVAFPNFMVKRGKKEDILARWRGTKAINLNFEQIFRNVELESRKPRDELSQKNVICFCWGSFNREFLVNAGVPENHTILTGNPTYNLYEPKLAACFPNRKELARKYHLDTQKKWIFIPENYSGAALSSEKREYYLKAGQTLEDLDDHVRYVENALNNAVKLWIKATENPQNEVIIRPRPINPTALFHYLCEKQKGSIPKNLHFIKEGTCREWILASDVITTSYSSTILESAYAGKPHYALAMEDKPIASNAEWHQYAPVIRSTEEFMQIIVDNKTWSKDSRLKDWIEQKIPDSKNSIPAMAKAIIQVLENEIEVPAISDDSLKICDATTAQMSTVGNIKFHLVMTLETLLRRMRLNKWEKRSITFQGNEIPYSFDNLDKVPRKSREKTIKRWRKHLSD